MLKSIGTFVLDLTIAGMSVMSLVTMYTRQAGWHYLNDGEPTIAWGYISIALAVVYYVCLAFRINADNTDYLWLSFGVGWFTQALSAAIVFFCYYATPLFLAWVPGTLWFAVSLAPTELATMLMFVGVTLILSSDII